MTHDELLAKLSSTNRRYAGSQDNSALRAVVEICRDYLGAYPNASEELENGLTIAFALVIQAIEKELG